MSAPELLMPRSEAWVRRITASKIPGLFNASKYSSPTKEYYLLRGELQPDGDSEVTERGRDFEPVILARFFRRHPELERVDSGSFSRPGLETWAAATPDAMARHRETGELFVIEAKTDGRGDYQWGATGSSEIPLGYYLQVQWQLHMTSCHRAYVVCLGPFYDETEHPITYDAALATEIEDHCREFHRNAMDPHGEPPEVDGHEETYNAIRRAHPDIDRGAHEDWRVSVDLAREFEAAVHGHSAAEEALNLMRSRLLRTMGTARRAVIGHGKNRQVVATRQPTKGGAVALYKFRKPIDWAAADLPPVHQS
ncbi:YqaJ viral recombinase family protein [Nocardia puris]|uniref:YqaJ viral recombinase family protein n=1 Tax=Nocardia puris TaxID=208602 RepID=UPI001895D9FE|nr:YqaJ viral recombinase family protein [Nocardia puris]MBF6460203.1 YqaJ viral recombinase family protein [Nocardia puris]